jgi:hypothetical protein
LYGGTPASEIKYHGVWTKANVPQITLSGKSKGIQDTENKSSTVDALVTLNIKDGAITKSFSFNMQIECYFNGLSTAWLK